MNEAERTSLKNNSLSKIVIYDNDPELYLLTRVFLQIPFQYIGMGSMVGKDYVAVKDFLEWNNFDLKVWTPRVLEMGKVWANIVNSSSSSS